VVRDITERQRAESSLRESEARLRTLVETAPTAIFIQTEGRFAYVNTAALELFGARNAEELLGKPVLERFHPDFRDSFSERIRLLDEERKTSPSIEERCLKLDGSPVEVDVSAVSFPFQNRSGALVFAHDISEHKLAEEALKQVHASLETRVKERTTELAVAKERAEESDRLKSAFLATMSHELRTPLNSIIGFTGILLQGLAGPTNEEQTKQLDMVRSSARHLLALINDVLDISKIEAGQLKVNLEAFLLHDSIQKTLATVRPLIEKKWLTRRAQIAPDIGEVVSDSRRVEQVLLNLMNNAIKFTERGEVAFSVDILSGIAPGTPAGLAEASVPLVRFRVADTGIGIKPEDLNYLFLPFRQVDCGLTRHHEGTGLGLTICRRLADLLGGEIQVASEFGKGSTFTFILPLKPLAMEKSA
jgi:PAS domain S-box-containing protein